MIHVVLLLNLISVVVGSWGALYAYQMFKRYSLRLFRSYTLYIVFFNAIILLTLVYIYVITNLMSGEQAAANTLFVVIAHMCDFFLEIGFVFFFIQVIAAMKGRPLGSLFRRIYIAAVVLLAFAFGVGITIFIIRGEARVLQNITTSSFVAALVIFIVFLIGLLRFKPEPGARIPLSVTRSFASFYLGGFVFFIFFGVLPAPVRMLAATVVYLMMNIWPLFWIHSIYLPAVRKDQILMTDEAVLERIAENHGLSKRELEILGFLLQGKSYREIEADLFISVNTVRNHVHNLYRKLGVGSRSRLVHFVLERGKV